MSRTVVGLFRDAREAEAVVNDLAESGFSKGDVSLVVKQSGGQILESPESKEADVSTSAGAGAALGGAAGLLLGLAALALPGIGPIVAAGPLAAALTGAGVGAAAGGMLGALSEMGVPESEAGHYAEGIKRGGTLVVVRADGDGAEKALAILNRHGAVDVDERAESWKKTGWSGFDPHSEPQTYGSEGSPSDWGRTTISDTRRAAARVYRRDFGRETGSKSNHP
ncbi:MAG: hypothetical protein ACRD7E_17575 [Bryobacteraceae bacterium]